jgi:hypothetical protein
MPQKQIHQIAMTALRGAAPINGDLGSERVHRVPFAAMGGRGTVGNFVLGGVILKQKETLNGPTQRSCYP